MKKIILILILILNFLYAAVYYRENDSPAGFVVVDTADLLDKPAHFSGVPPRCKYTNSEFVGSEGVTHYSASFIGGRIYNQCLSNLSKFYGVETITIDGCGGFYPEQYYKYCRDFYNDKNCTYSNDAKAYVCNGHITCPPGYKYNEITEQCENKPQCPTGTQLDNLAIQKCGSSDFVDYESCNPDTGEVTIICKSCDDIIQYLSYYCEAHDGVLKNGKYSCTQRADGSLSLNFSDVNISICEFPTDNETNNSDNNTSNDSCPEGYIAITDESGKTSCEPLNSNDNNSNNNNNNSNNSNYNNNNNDNSNNSNNTCPNPCYLMEHKPIGYQEVSYNKNGFSCHKITYPTYENCFLEYHMDDLTCIPGCDNLNSSSNSSGNNVNVKVNIDTSGIENKLDSIDQKLDDLKNLQPDSDFSVDTSLPADEQSYYDDFINYINGAKDSLSSLKNDAQDVLNFIKKPEDFMNNNLKNNVVSCKLNFTLYGKANSLDPCAFISPYRPLIEFFLTLFFSFEVIFYFINVLINSKQS